MKRIKELDGIRGIAILLVLTYHYFFNGAVIDSQLVNQFLKLLHLGWSGVDLFFVLSGFLIVGVLLDSKIRATFFPSFISVEPYEYYRYTMYYLHHSLYSQGLFQMRIYSNTLSHSGAIYLLLKTSLCSSLILEAAG
ncbi:MAG: acyltransferase [Anaerolineales bacterium]|nr:acyltransferase [Anaerolineales bacterium]